MFALFICGEILRCAIHQRGDAGQNVNPAVRLRVQPDRGSLGDERSHHCQGQEELQGEDAEHLVDEAATDLKMGEGKKVLLL